MVGQFDGKCEDRVVSVGLLIFLLSNISGIRETNCTHLPFIGMIESSIVGGTEYLGTSERRLKRQFSSYDCSHWGPEFGSYHPYQAAHRLL